MEQLTNLQGLDIYDCPDLKRWCELEENMMKLAHIEGKVRVLPKLALCITNLILFFRTLSHFLILEFTLSCISYRGFFHAEMSTYSSTLSLNFPFVKHHFTFMDEFPGF
jgi:hypothetical protein